MCGLQGGRSHKDAKKLAKADKKLDEEIEKVEAQPVRYKQLTAEERAEAEMYVAACTHRPSLHAVDMSRCSLPVASVQACMPC